MKTLKLCMYVCFIAIVAVNISSCKKAKLNKATTTAEDNGTAESLYEDAFSSVDDAAKGESSINKTGESLRLATDSICATITVNPPAPDSTFPKTVTIDFGTTNCTGSDGRIRRGKIISTLTGRYRTTGTVVTVSFTDFYINDYHIEGTKTITNNGRNSSGNLSFTVQVAGGKVTSPEGDVISWESTRTKEWIAGESTKLYIWDDVYSITGNASGVNREGRNYTASITNALRKEIGCRWIVSGTFEVAPQDLDTRTIDYGDGTCDNKAIVTVNNKQKEITLR